VENPFCNHQKRTTKEVSLIAIIPQQRLFGWQEIDELGDLERFLLVVNHLPDEQLMQKLERERGKGRDDCPVRAVWNSILAGIVFQHVSVESLRRELCRNGQLRELCGFDPARGEDAVPPSYIYSRILVKLMRHADEVENIFTRLVDEIRVLLPDFGRILAIDSKAVSSLARGKKRDRETLKYRCPARHYGVECRGMEQCAATGGIRIPLVEDRRIFTPLARSSYKWKTLYKKRTAVERVNARLDEAYGFEKHFIRGLKKMKLRCGLALMVMLAMAVGRLRQKQGIDLRSLVKAA